MHFFASLGTDLGGGDSSQMPQLTQHGNPATELREAFGVRGACSRFRTAPRLTTAPASWTHSRRFAQILASPHLCGFGLICLPFPLMGSPRNASPPYRLGFLWPICCSLASTACGQLLQVDMHTGCTEDAEGIGAPVVGYSQASTETVDGSGDAPGAPLERKKAPWEEGDAPV